MGWDESGMLAALIRVIQSGTCMMARRALF